MNSDKIKYFYVDRYVENIFLEKNVELAALNE